MKGTLYGIGVGSGKPELLTYEAKKRIENCMFLAVPDSGKKRSVAYTIVVQAMPELVKRNWIFIPMPMTKEKAVLQQAHNQGAETLLSYLEQGDVGFLTLGDPSVYATYSYLQQLVLQKGGQAEMIAGIPSFCAVAAALGISLTEGEEMLHVVPASYGIEEALSLSGTKILMKAGKQFQKVKECLWQKKDTIHCYMVENCGMEQEKKYFSLEEFPEEAGYFSTIVVKEKKD